MEIRCPYCEKSVQIPGGGQFTCPSCKAIFAVDLEPQAPTLGAPAAPALGAPSAPTIPPPLPTPTPQSQGTDFIPAKPATVVPPSSDLVPPPLPPGLGVGPPPLPGAVPPPVQTGGGAICAKHPGRPAGEVCRRCGNFMCSLCVIPYQNERYCPDCIDKASGGGLTNTIAWESDREKLGILGAYFATMKEVLFNGDRFYQGMPTDSGLGAPFVFHFVPTWIFGGIGMCFSFAFNSVFLGAMARGAGGGAPPILAQNAIMLVLQLAVFLPVFTVLDIFLGSALDHVVCLILGGKASYEATVRLRCYAAGATGPIQGIPIAGGLIAWLWKWISEYYGFKNVHGLSSGKALLVVVWPLIFICCCGTISVFALIAAGASSGGGGGGF